MVNYKFIAIRIQELQKLLEKLQNYKQVITDIAEKIFDTLKSGRKVFICGNGGSFSQSQHFAAEFTVRPYRDCYNWKPQKVIALGSNPAHTTACSNDFSFRHIFEKELDALGERGDVLILISTSGNSESIVSAARQGKCRGMCLIGLLGNNGGRVVKYCNISIIIPSRITARIQEAHLFILHVICKIVSDKIVKDYVKQNGL